MSPWAAHRRLNGLVTGPGLLLGLALVAEFTRRRLRVFGVVLGRGVVAAVAAPVPRVVVFALAILGHRFLLVDEEADGQPVLAFYAAWIVRNPGVAMSRATCSRQRDNSRLN